ncbi:tyrosine-protein kinase ITK/TSK [Capsaspora owczarzaki ATCC 30864]|uniref:TKL protein kinase n=1 Tax=Capsaspora owczarzaki (strain ATCC 30864) TaxID=595528 RepID=A0A0D2VUE3_CAPO3|nr:tyrosine-protein kinase ITK/TSK [Capsaspora owczarzaki ATCC 30864]KJE95002.1 TKL protein kinase [Capsaspora owczarzaki ATCC 30864]|eukprot:XP_004346205.2 tyrosine-protein kinase ITK/TSK [Capsaspora owczarzaki ATCC 30864]
MGFGRVPSSATAKRLALGFALAFALLYKPAIAGPYRATCFARALYFTQSSNCGEANACDPQCTGWVKFGSSSPQINFIASEQQSATPRWSLDLNVGAVENWDGSVQWSVSCIDIDGPIFDADDDMGSLLTQKTYINANQEYGNINVNPWQGVNIGATTGGDYNIPAVQVYYRAMCDTFFYGTRCSEYCRVNDPPACTGCNTQTGVCTCSVGYGDKDCGTCTPNYYPNGVSGQPGFFCQYCLAQNNAAACYTCQTNGAKSCCVGWKNTNCDTKKNCGTFLLPPANAVAVTSTCQCTTYGCTCQYTCKPGFTGGSATTTCMNNELWTWSSTLACNDIDECAPGGGNQCAQICTNTIGDYSCSCNSGYAISNAGRGPNGCVDINECSTHNGGCGHICNNALGTYYCTCQAGWRLQPNSRNCTEINECQEGLDNCDGNAICTNTIGSFECQCASGFSGNGTVCTDVNECSTSPCDEHASCTNYAGNFTCTCAVGYEGTGFECAIKSRASFAEDSRFMLIPDGGAGMSSTINLRVEMVPEVNGTPVFFNVSSVGATVGTDYLVATASPLMFNLADTHKNISIVLIGSDRSATIQSIQVQLQGASSQFTTATIVIDAHDNQTGVVRFAEESRAFRVDITAGTYSLTIERYSYASLVKAINVTVRCDFPVPQNISIVIPANQAAATKVIQLPFSSVPTLDAEHTYTIVDAMVTGSGSAAAIGYYSTSRVTVNAHDDPYGVFGFSLTHVSVAESSTGFVQLKRLKGTLGTTVVRVRSLTLSSGQTNGVGIASPSDYAAVSQLVTFSENDVEAHVSIAVLADGVPELDEMFGLLLEYVSGPGRVDATLALALVTIPENDNARGVLSITRVSSCFEESPLVGGVPQPNNTVAIEVIRSGGLYGAIAFTWSMHSGRFKNTTLSADNRASAPEDYTALSTQAVIIAAGVDRAQIEVMLLDDEIPELDEYFWVQLDSASYGATIDPVSNFTDVCIGMNDNPFGALAFESVSLTPSATGESRLLVRESDVVTVAVSRVGGTFRRVSGVVSIAHETTSSADFADSSARTVTFEPGQSTALASWTISADSAQEPTELFKLVLTANGASAGQEATFLVGATSLDSTIPCAIEAQDGVNGVLSFVQPTVSVVEDDGKVTLTVQRVGGSATAVSFQATAMPLSASGDDFDASNQNNSYTLAVGETSVSFDIQIEKDAIPELDETFTVTLVNVAGATLSWTSVATVTILKNDDVNGVVEFAPSSGQNPLVTIVSEDAGVIRLSLWREVSQVGLVTLSFVLSTNVTSDPAFAPLSGLNLPSRFADLTLDVTTAPFMVTFEDGQNQTEIVLPLHDNGLLDGGRVLFVRLANVQGGARLGTAQAMAILIRDDESSAGSQPDSNSAPIGAAVGAAAGGILFVLVLVIVIGMLRRRGRSRQSAIPTSKPLPAAAEPTYEAVSRNHMYANALLTSGGTYDSPQQQQQQQEDPYEFLPQIVRNANPVYAEAPTYEALARNPALDDTYDSPQQPTLVPSIPDKPRALNSANRASVPARVVSTAGAPDFGAMRASFAGANANANVPSESDYDALYITTLDSFQREQQFSRNELQFTTQLGAGNFGEVWLAHVPARWLSKHARGSDSSGATTAAVAVKTLKSDATDKSKSDFASEAQIMRRFSHPNIVSVVEVFVEQEPWMLVLELLVYGDLRNVIQSCSSRGLVPTVGEYLHIFSQVASGLSYLAELHFVHRDIAARNCLVGTDLVVKISDFGLSRELDEQNYYRMQTRGALPVRWMSPEFLLFRKSSPASDVWALGVLMWEVMSAGLSPYPGIEPKALVDFLEKGGRLPRPDHCSDPLWQAMSNCWMWEAENRIDARQLHAAFAHMAAQHSGGVRDLGALLASAK